MYSVSSRNAISGLESSKYLNLLWNSKTVAKEAREDIVADDVSWASTEISGKEINVLFVLRKPGKICCGHKLKYFWKNKNPKYLFLGYKFCVRNKFLRRGKLNRNTCVRNNVFLFVTAQKIGNGNYAIVSSKRTRQRNTWQKYIKKSMVFLLTYTVSIIFMNILQGFQVYVHVQPSDRIYIQSINTKN